MDVGTGLSTSRARECRGSIRGPPPFETKVRHTQIHKWLWVKTNGSHFGAGPPPILVYFGGDWDVHWGYGILTRGQIAATDLT